jgi:hypothetical protein
MLLVGTASMKVASARQENAKGKRSEHQVRKMERTPMKKVERDQNHPLKEWITGQTVHLNGYDVFLSVPVLVAQSKEYLCMPTMALLANGDLVISMCAHKDVPYYPNPGAHSFSRDGGLTWTKPVADTSYGYAHLRLPSEDELYLPFYLIPTARGKANEITAIGAPYNRIRKGRQEFQLVDPGVEVTGWPEPPDSGQSENCTVALASFAFDGQTVLLKDGSYFATLYGFYKSGGSRIVGARSTDGVHWRIVGTIAKRLGKVNERGEGPTEPAVCRLKDGRLMCIYRLDSNLTYGQTWSSDEGRTWTEPVECQGPRSVEPSLVVLKSGTVVLSGGRPELKLWINKDGTGKDWQEVDIQTYRYGFIKNSDSTGYTEIVALDDTHLLYVYDYGRSPGSVWIIRVTLQKT